MRIGVITQARTTSTRLPGKVLLEVGGKTVLDHHLDRLAGTALPVVVAATINAADDPVAEIAERRGLRCHRGSELDVLARFYTCAAENDLAAVVRVTSDCPLIDPALIRRGVDVFVEADDPMLYVSNGLSRTFPRGFDFEVFSFTALAEAHTNATEPYQREHVTPYLYATPGTAMRLHSIDWPEDKSAYRVTVDTADDLALVRALIEDHHAAELDCAGIIKLLDERPALVELNAHVKQKKLGE